MIRASSLGDVDLATAGAALGERLRGVGVPVTARQVAWFVRGLSELTPATTGELYWIGRITMVRSPEHFEAFDAVFDEVFRGLADVADSRGDDNAPEVDRQRPARPRTRYGRHAVQPTGDASAVSGSNDDANESDEELVLAVASADERLATTDFGELTDDELRDLYDLMRQIRIGLPARQARRRRRHRHGDELDLRATLRRSRQHGGDPIERVTRRPHERPRKLVVLCDISGSMAPYSRACIQLLHAAASSSRAEVFTFATRLTRLTKTLAITEPDVALARAAEAAPDWKGGTRIGPSLKAFLDDYGRRGIARGAVVVIVSDGWDRGDPLVVGEQMARLRRLAHRIVWINPRSAAAGFEPLAGGMAAALPSIDELVSGHTLVDLAGVMSSLG